MRLWQYAITFFATLAGVAFNTAASSQDVYPSRPIHFVVGFAAGSPPDIMVRFFAREVQAKSGRPVVVDNRPGAIGSIGATSVARAKPDGYTVLFASASTLAGNVYLLKEQAIDPLKDLVPVAPLLTTAFAFAVSNQSPIRTLRELTDHLLKKGDDAKFGFASPFALGGTELYQSRIGSKARGVPYRSSVDAWNALQGGETDFIFGDLQSLVADPPRGRALAIGSRERYKTLPNVPSASEAGLPDYDMSTFWAVFAPAGTPQDIIAKLRDWIGGAVESDEGTKFIVNTTASNPLVGVSGDELHTRLKNEIELWRELVRVAKIEPQ